MANFVAQVLANLGTSNEGCGTLESGDSAWPLTRNWAFTFIFFIWRPTTCFRELLEMMRRSAIKSVTWKSRPAILQPFNICHTDGGIFLQCQHFPSWLYHVGAGINYIIFFDNDFNDRGKEAGLDLKWLKRLEDRLPAGVDYLINRDWLLTVRGTWISIPRQL